MRPYVSIDIETTGIDPKSEILQISAIYDNGEDIEELKRIDLVIKHEFIAYSEPYALGMNAELLRAMMDPEFITYTPEHTVSRFMCFLTEVYHSSENKDNNGKPRKILFSGKNVASFDIPKIRDFIQKYGGEGRLADFNKITHYKTLDVGSLYFDIFQDNASLSEINKITGRKSVSHNALDDALDVVYAIRYKLNSI